MNSIEDGIRFYSVVEGDKVTYYKVQCVSCEHVQGCNLPDEDGYGDAALRCEEFKGRVK